MISLYVKTHKQTGLKYFGKTVQDPFSYLGSGIRWTRHLAKYGNDVSTEIIGQFENIDECSKVALQFSAENDIVKSKEWANLIPENGMIGGAIHNSPHSDETKLKISEANKGRLVGEKNPRFGIRLLAEENGFFGKTHSDETKLKISEANKGRLVGEKNPAKRPEVREKLSANNVMKLPEQRERASLRISGDGNPAKRPEVREKLSKPKRKEICQFCQKEIGSHNIKRHIEAKHNEIV